MQVIYAVAAAACLVAAVAASVRSVRRRQLLRYFDKETLSLMRKLGIRVDRRLLPEGSPTDENFDPRCLRLREGVLLEPAHDTTYDLRDYEELGYITYLATDAKITRTRRWSLGGMHHDHLARFRSIQRRKLQPPVAEQQDQDDYQGSI